MTVLKVDADEDGIGGDAVHGLFRGDRAESAGRFHPQGSDSAAAAGRIREFLVR